MQAKLTLKLEDLSVDSFNTAPQKPQAFEDADARTCLQTGCGPYFCCA